MTSQWDQEQIEQIKKHRQHRQRRPKRLNVGRAYLRRWGYDVMAEVEAGAHGTGLAYKLLARHSLRDVPTEDLLS